MSGATSFFSAGGAGGVVEPLPFASVRVVGSVCSAVPAGCGVGKGLEEGKQFCLIIDHYHQIVATVFLHRLLKKEQIEGVRFCSRRCQSFFYLFCLGEKLYCTNMSAVTERGLELARRGDYVTPYLVKSVAMRIRPSFSFLPFRYHTLAGAFWNLLA